MLDLSLKTTVMILFDLDEVFPSRRESSQILLAFYHFLLLAVCVSGFHSKGAAD